MTLRLDLFTNNPTPIPPANQWLTVERLWNAARLLLAGLVVGGVIVAALLSAGTADPLRAGPLAWEMSPSTSVDLLAYYTIARVGNPVALPPIYTLEVSAVMSGDPSASWNLLFLDSADHSLFAVIVDGRQFYSVPPFASDSIAFIHLHPGSSSGANTLSWTVEKGGQATLRINEETAWHGVAPSAVSVAIAAAGGRTQTAHLVIQHVALYIPR